MLRITPIFFLILFLSSGSLIGQTALNLDNSFGTNGIVSTNFDQVKDGINAMAYQNNKLIAAGFTYQQGRDQIAVARYENDGNLDVSFGANGKVITTFGGQNDGINDILVFEDNSILIGGYSLINNTNRFAFFKMNSYGLAAQDFGTNGAASFALDSYDDQCKSIAFLPDGNIVAAGNSSNGQDNDIALLSITASGRLNSSFGNIGEVVVDLGSDESVEDMCVLPEGKILVTGCQLNTGDYKMIVMRFNADGSLDYTFGTNGIYTSSIGNFSDKGTSIHVLNSGKILIGGYLYDGNQISMSVIRLNANGTLDQNFANNGRQLLSQSNTFSYVFDIDVQTDGKIILAGNTFNGLNQDILLHRLNSDGSIDQGFQANGNLSIDISNGHDYLKEILIQTDGKIITAGYSQFQQDYDFTMIRINNDVSLSNGNDIITPNQEPVIQIINKALMLSLPAGSDAGTSEVNIFDVNGRILYKNSFNNGRTYSIPVQDSHACLIVSVYNSHNLWTKKVYIN